MSDSGQGPGWWQASDGNWYPPEQQPGAAPAAAPGGDLGSEPSVVYAPVPPAAPAAATPPPPPPPPPAPPGASAGWPTGATTVTGAVGTPGSPPPPAPPGFGGPPIPPPGGSNRKFLLVAGIVVAIAVIAGILLVVTGGDDDEPTTTADRSSQSSDDRSDRSDRSNGSDRSDRSTTSRRRPNTTISDRPTTTDGTTGTGQALQLVEHGFTAFDPYEDGDLVASYAAVYKNPNTDLGLAYVSVELSFTDASGVEVGTASESIGFVLPGQTTAIGGTAYELDGLPTTLKLTITYAEEIPVSITTDGVTASGLTLEANEYGGNTTEGTLHNDLPVEANVLYLIAVYKNAAGAVVGGDFDFIDPIPAGGDVPFEVVGLDDIPGVASGSVYVVLDSSVLDAG